MIFAHGLSTAPETELLSLPRLAKPHNLHPLDARKGLKKICLGSLQQFGKAQSLSNLSSHLCAKFFCLLLLEPRIMRSCHTSQNSKPLKAVIEPSDFGLGWCTACCCLLTSSKNLWQPGQPLQVAALTRKHSKVLAQRLWCARKQETLALLWCFWIKSGT